ncbi:unnamed protein product [Brassicogethes aeneus]|nr:unnamed protein product [Brassicogethes aeneus]
MEKQSKVKSRKKLINPVFHLQTKEDDDGYITKDVIKSVRKTGQLNLSGRHLAIVPPKVFKIYDAEDEKDVTIDFSRSPRDDDAWWNINPLTNLDLGSNILTKLPDEIGVFSDLLTLNLQDNNLTGLPKTIANFKKLIKLNLNRNILNQIPVELCTLTELKQFSISHNQLECVPTEFSNLIMLEKLDLSNNSVSNLPPGLGFLIRLNEINLSNNKLREIPPDLVNLRDLLKLDLRNNNIQYLPNMGEMRKLQILYASHNDIEKIPDFQGCQQLQELYFGNNFIKEVPEDFCEHLLHLKTLELRDNQIAKIPDNFCLPHLNKLDLTNNELASVPSCLAQLPHLQTIKLEGNKMKLMRSDVIRGGTTRILRHLREMGREGKENEISPKVTLEEDKFPDRYTMKNGKMLNLAMKKISYIPDKCFSEAKEANVDIVDICKNIFTEVPMGLKSIANNILELNLSQNHLKTIPEWFNEFTKLKYCNLSNNYITNLPDSMKNLTSLRELVISNNR